MKRKTVLYDMPGIKLEKSRGYMKRILAILLCMAMLAGCGSGGGENQMPQMNSKVEAAMQEEASSTADENTSVVPLQEENDIPADGVISKEQMQTIAGQDKTIYFNGMTEDGIVYQWSYDAKQIQNPTEQKLLVETSTDGLENIKKEAANAPYALAIRLQEMQLAAAPTLTLTLKEAWNADKVLYCCEEDGLKKLSDVTVSSAETADGTVTVLSFPVAKTGDVFYLVGGSTAGSGDETSDVSEAEEASETDENAQNTSASDKKNEKNTDKKTASADKKAETKEEKKKTCTISIDCKTILDNLDKLRSSKTDYVPADGWILYKSTVEFDEGDTVFDILKCVTKEAGIQMESKWTPMYNSYYIEGINHLYEFDCGVKSGWMYSVNGWYPNYGCSSYEVKDGDKIEWRYTCDLGSDVGDKYMGD